MAKKTARKKAPAKVAVKKAAAKKGLEKKTARPEMLFDSRITEAMAREIFPIPGDWHPFSVADWHPHKPIVNVSAAGKKATLGRDKKGNFGLFLEP